MVPDTLTLKNAALIKIQEPPMTTESDSGTAPDAVNNNYDRCRTLVLSRHRWNFAQKRCLINKTGVPPFRYKSMLAVPNDLLQLEAVYYCNEPYSDYLFEQRQILSDPITLGIQYTQDVSDVTVFPDLFVESLCCMLAEQIAPLILNNDSASARLNQDYAGAITKACQRNLIESPQQERPDPYDAWTDARRVATPFRGRYDPYR